MYRSDLDREIEQLKRANAELSLLNDIANSIGLTFEFEGIVRAIIDKSIRAVRAEQGAIVLVGGEDDPAAHTLDRRVVTSGGPTDLGINPLVVGWMVLHKEPLNLFEPRQDERFGNTEWDESIDSIACVPMIVQTNLIGILAVFNKRPRSQFTDDDMRLLEIIASASAQVVENARLHGVEELHEKLKAYQIQLIRSKTMAALGSLVAGLLHEINTPLGVIRSANDVSVRCVHKIRQVLETKDDSAATEFNSFLSSLEEDSHAIAGAQERIARIVNSLKSFAPLNGSLRLEFDVREGLENALTLLRYEFPDDISVIREYGDVPNVICYRAEITQVFVHLLTNALHAIDGPGTIALRTSSDDDNVHIQIGDTGRGVAPERIKHLFDPVFSDEGSRVKAGLGLFTCANIIDKHGGDIKLETKLGEGTTFTVTLPQRMSDERTSPTDPALRRE